MNFSVQPPPGEVWRIERMIITINDHGITDFSEYGNLAKLTQGIKIFIRNTTTIRDLTGMEMPDRNIHSMGDWLTNMYDCQLLKSQGGSTVDYYVCRWTFAKAGNLIRLDGDLNESFYMQLNDSFIGLDAHHFLVQGYKEVEEVNEQMAGLAIIIFMMGAILALFILPFKVRFAQHNILNEVLRRCMWIIALWLTSLTTVMLATIAAAAKYNLANEIYRFMWIVNWGAYLFMFYIVLEFFFTMITFAKEEGKKVRMDG